MDSAEENDIWTFKSYKSLETGRAVGYNIPERSGTMLEHDGFFEDLNDNGIPDILEAVTALDDRSEFMWDIESDTPYDAPESDEGAVGADAFDADEGFTIEGIFNRLEDAFDIGSPASVCARVSTGTQNYCPFSGSGR